MYTIHKEHVYELQGSVIHDGYRPTSYTCLTQPNSLLPKEDIPQRLCIETIEDAFDIYKSLLRARLLRAKNEMQQIQLDIIKADELLNKHNEGDIWGKA